MNQITYGYVGCCPICGQAPVGGREYLCGHNPSTNQQSASADDPRDAEIAKLREALTKITAEIVKSIALALKMEEASAWAACALNLALSMNRINSIAVQALAEPGGKP